MPHTKIILVTDTRCRIGHLTATALAHGGHTVYAACGAPACRQTRQVAARLRAYGREQGIDLRPFALDPGDGRAVAAAVGRIVGAHGRIDVLVHAPGGPLSSPPPGPAEAITPEQLASAFDESVGTAQRMMRAALPPMRRQSRGLVVWMVSSAAAGAALPYLALHCARAAALDALAVQYARELAPWGIETSIVMPGVFGEYGEDGRSRRDGESGVVPSVALATTPPADPARVHEYEAGPTGWLTRAIRGAAQAAIPAPPVPDAAAGAAAGAVAEIVDTPFGDRPFRMFAAPAHDGAGIVAPVMDRIREDMLRRLGLGPLLRPARSGNSARPAA